MKLKAFRVGEQIPDGARYVRSEDPRTLLSWLGITETVATMVKVETVDIYEVSE